MSTEAKCETAWLPQEQTWHQTASKSKVLIKLPGSNVAAGSGLFVFRVWSGITAGSHFQILAFETRIRDSITPERTWQKPRVDIWKISIYVWVGSQGKVPRCVSVKSQNRKIKPVFLWHAFAVAAKEWVNEWWREGETGLLPIFTSYDGESVPVHVPGIHLGLISERETNSRSSFLYI